MLDKHLASNVVLFIGTLQ